jgi:hypothetical protein
VVLCLGGPTGQSSCPCSERAAERPVAARGSAAVPLPAPHALWPCPRRAPPTSGAYKARAPSSGHLFLLPPPLSPRAALFLPQARSAGDPPFSFAFIQIFLGIDPDSSVQVSVPIAARSAAASPNPPPPGAPSPPAAFGERLRLHRCKMASPRSPLLMEALPRRLAGAGARTVGPPPRPVRPGRRRLRPAQARQRPTGSHGPRSSRPAGCFRPVSRISFSVNFRILLNRRN